MSGGTPSRLFSQPDSSSNMRRAAIAAAQQQTRSSSATRLNATTGSNGLLRTAFNTPSTVASAYGIRASAVSTSNSPHRSALSSTAGRSRATAGDSPAVVRSMSSSRPSSGALAQPSAKRSASPSVARRDSNAYALPEPKPVIRRNSSSTSGDAYQSSSSRFAGSSVPAAKGAASMVRPLGSSGMAGLRGGIAHPVRAFAPVPQASVQAGTATNASASAVAALSLLTPQRAVTDAVPSYTRTTERRAYESPKVAADSATNIPSSLMNLHAVRQAATSSPSLLAQERAFLRQKRMMLDQPHEQQPSSQQHTTHSSTSTLQQQSPSLQSAPHSEPRRASGRALPPYTQLQANGAAASASASVPPVAATSAGPASTMFVPTQQHPYVHSNPNSSRLVPSPLSNASSPVTSSSTYGNGTGSHPASPSIAPRALFSSPSSSGFSTSASSPATSNGTAGTAAHSVSASTPRGNSTHTNGTTSSTSGSSPLLRVNSITQHIAPSTAGTSASTTASNGHSSTPESARRTLLSSSTAAATSGVDSSLPSARSAYHVSRATSLPSSSGGTTAAGTFAGTPRSSVSQSGAYYSAYDRDDGPESSHTRQMSEDELEREQEEAEENERRLVANSRRSSYDPQRKRDEMQRIGVTLNKFASPAQQQRQAQQQSSPIESEPSVSRTVSFSLAVPVGALASRSSGGRMRALVGLANLGNTCFLNSTLQCLLSTPGFLPYFATGEFEKDINPKGARTKGALAQSFGELAQRMVRASDHSVERPGNVKHAVSIIDSKFSGYGQHDSHEFGRVLLSALHDELNRIRIKPPYVEITDLETDSVGTKADRWWRNHTERNQSIVMECFAGQLQSSLQCLTCKRRSEAFDPFLDLSLPIPKQRSSSGGLSSAFSRFSLGGSSSAGVGGGAVSRCTLLACFDEFLREEVLSGHEQVYCRLCKNHRDHSKKLHVYRWPHMLVIHLKRFSFGAYTRTKINTDVDFDNELDLRQLAGAAHKGQTPPIYSLYGVSSHCGTANGGHYIAHCKVSDSDKAPFYTFNDSVVHAESGTAFKGPSAYLLFYRRKDD